MSPNRKLSSEPTSENKDGLSILDRLGRVSPRARRNCQVSVLASGALSAREPATRTKWFGEGMQCAHAMMLCVATGGEQASQFL